MFILIHVANVSCNTPQDCQMLCVLHWHFCISINILLSIYISYWQNSIPIQFYVIKTCLKLVYQWVYYCNCMKSYITRSSSLVNKVEDKKISNIKGNTVLQMIKGINDNSLVVPVCSQPSLMVLAVASGFLKYPFMILGPRTTSSPSFPYSTGVPLSMSTIWN